MAIEIVDIFASEATIEDVVLPDGATITQIEMRKRHYADILNTLRSIANHQPGDTAETTKDARDLHAYFNHASTIYHPEQIHPPSINPQKYIWIHMEYETWKRTLSAVLRIIKREDTN